MNDPDQYKLDIAKGGQQDFLTILKPLVRREELELLSRRLWNSPCFLRSIAEMKRIVETSILVGSSRAFETIWRQPSAFARRKSGAATCHLGSTRQRTLPGHANIPWMDKLETNISRAIALKTQEPDDVTFRGRDGHIYRAHPDPAQTLQEWQTQVLCTHSRDFRSQICRRPPNLHAADRAHFGLALALHFLSDGERR